MALEVSILLFLFPFLFSRFYHFFFSVCLQVISVIVVTGCRNESLFSLVSLFTEFFKLLHPHKTQKLQIIHIPISEVLASSLRKIRSNSQDRQNRYLFFWLDFCYGVLFREIFFFYLSSFFPLNFLYLMLSSLNILSCKWLSISTSVLIFYWVITSILAVVSLYIIKMTHFSIQNSISIFWL